MVEGDAAAAAGGGNGDSDGDGGGRTLWRAVVYVRVYARARIRAREYRDSSLKIQMEYRAFEEREVPRGVRGGGL